jgi:hypothetical protein
MIMERKVEEKVLEDKLAEELIAGWEIVPTGSGFWWCQPGAGRTTK